MEELIGFVAGNNLRRRVLALLATEAQEGSVIAKKLRVGESTAIKMLDGLAEKGLVSKDGNKYQLTETGLAVDRQMMGVSR